MVQATTILKNESKNQADLGESATVKFDVPVFDKSVDYVAKVKEQTMLLKKVQGLHEDHSVDFLSMLKEFLRS